mmetsp:Transcript_52051/g.130711  ORF Transcript_52051/g.130711 Transcript_52051/m.130711 type:complete len:140 (-) Transcript_52051:28-447(-)
MVLFDGTWGKMGRKGAKAGAGANALLRACAACTGIGGASALRQCRAAHALARKPCTSRHTTQPAPEDYPADACDELWLPRKTSLMEVCTRPSRTSASHHCRMLRPLCMVQVRLMLSPGMANHRKMWKGNGGSKLIEQSL